MPRLANPLDLPRVALLLMEMYLEVFGDKASTNLDDYIKEVFKYYIDSTTFIYVDNEYKGIFIVKDDTSPLTPGLKRYNGYSVYIQPKHRKGKLLYNFYKKLFIDFPDGDILGYTEIDSEHIKVCNKRHKHIMNVYKLDRGL